MDDYVMHMQRSTLLDSLIEDNPLTAKKKTISRMMYAARCTAKDKETDKERLTNYHIDLLQNAAHDKIELLSGFLLIYPSCCVHSVEADTPVLLAILKLLDTQFPYVDSVRIISFTEDVPFRIFSGWMSGFIISANMGPYDPYAQNSLIGMMSELNINMLKWGRMLSEMDENQQTVALDSIRTAAEELLSDDQGVVYGILLSEDTPKLKDVLELFDQRQAHIMFDAVDLAQTKGSL